MYVGVFKYAVVCICIIHSCIHVYAHARALVSRVKELLGRDKIRQKVLGRAIGLSGSTISQVSVCLHVQSVLHGDLDSRSVNVFSVGASGCDRYLCVVLRIVRKPFWASVYLMPSASSRTIDNTFICLGLPCICLDTLRTKYVRRSDIYY